MGANEISCDYDSQCELSKKISNDKGGKTIPFATG